MDWKTVPKRFWKCTRNSIHNINLRLANAGGGAVATGTLDLDEAGADVCTRCSPIPWVHALESYRTRIESFSPACRICRLLLSTEPCQENDIISVRLARMPVPREIQDLLDEQKCQFRAFQVERSHRHGLSHDFTMLVSDLSHEQADMTLQRLSISPVMSLSRIGNHI